MGRHRGGGMDPLTKGILLLAAIAAGVLLIAAGYAERSLGWLEVLF